MDLIDILCLTRGISDEAFTELQSILGSDRFLLSRVEGPDNPKEKNTPIDFVWCSSELLTAEQIFRDELTICIDPNLEPRKEKSNIHCFGSIQNAAVYLCGYFSALQTINDHDRTIKEYGHYRQQFLKVFEGGSDAIAITDLHGNFTLVNQRATDLFGYSDPSEIVGMNILQIVHPDYHSQAWYSRNTAFETGASGEQVLGFIRKNGSLIEIVNNLYLLREIDGQPAGFIGFTHQIHHSNTFAGLGEEKETATETTFKQARELREAYGKLETEVEKRKQVESHRDILSRILEETTDIVAYADSNLKIVYMNQAGIDFFGITSQEEYNQRTIMRRQHPDDILKMREEIYPIATKEGIWRGEWYLTNYEGERTPVSQIVICHHLSNGSILYSTIARDITEQRRREEQYLESQKWYRALSEAAHDMIFAISEDDRIMYLNSFAANALGVDPEGEIGNPPSDYFGAGTTDQMKIHLNRVFFTGQPNYYENIIDFRNIALWLGTWLVPIKDREEKTIAVLGIARDISAFKQSEDQLIKSLAREKELNDLKTRFISMASHEFRTPLSTILSSVELLDTYSYTWPDEKKTKHYHRIRDAVMRMNEILEDVLVMGRDENGDTRANFIQVDPISVISNVVEEIVQADAKRHEIQFFADGENQSILTDPEALRRIVENLVGNSRKYSPEGTQIQIRLHSEETKISLEIQDQGVGIPEDEIDLVADPFYRGRNVSSISGSGLGLTIVYMAVERCGGEIEIKSHTGAGTKVTVTLPRVVGGS